MANCDMCGKETNLFLAEIEGTELSVCNECARFGKIVKRSFRPKPRERRHEISSSKKQTLQIIREDFSDIIRKKREKLGLKQEQMAKRLAEKESLLHKIETGNIVPSMKLARKLEKILNVTLIEEQEVISQELKTKTNKLTIGDMISIK